MNPAASDATPAFSILRALPIQAAPPVDSGQWLDTDLIIRTRIMQAHPDLTDDDIWDLLQNG